MDQGSHSSTSCWTTSDSRYRPPLPGRSPWRRWCRRRTTSPKSPRNSKRLGVSGKLGHPRGGKTMGKPWEKPWKLEVRWILHELESRRRRTKGSVVGEEWCQNAAPLRWYTKNVFAQSKMILSRAWLHDTVSCAAWNDARKGVYLKPLFKTPCSNCYWGWSIPIMLDCRDISLMESVPLMWGPVTASPVGIEPMTILLISNT